MQIHRITWRIVTWLTLALALTASAACGGERRQDERGQGDRRQDERGQGERGQGERGQGERGSGVRATEERRVAPFTRVKVSGSFQVEIRVDPAASGEITLALAGDDDLLPHVVTRSEGGTLTISTERSVSFDTPPTLSFTVADLEHVESSGSTGIRAAGVRNRALRVHSSGAGRVELEATTETLALESSGSSEIVLAGQAGRLEVRISGSGALHAKELKATDATLRISGSGNAEVCVTGTLEVEVSGSGDVRHHCNPTQVVPRISGSGSVAPG